jgi:TonB-dependent SusC/RagA subfamily outer membrane receptor
MPRSVVRARLRPGTLVLAVAATAGLAACVHSGPPAPPRPASEKDSVPVAYGTEAKRNMTGSVSSVDAEAVRKGSTITSMADLLEGRVPGLEVRRLGNGQVSVRIRGDRSINSDGEPLYVVDGIPMNGNSILSDLDPREVKSIEVLKDAGSLAAYGSRGANGVILIRLKKPPRP